MPTREYYLNSDFDLSLRGRPSLLESADATFIHEMAWHYLFAAGPADSLIVHRPLPEDFLAYLSGKGLPAPRQVLDPSFSPESLFIPFGWDVHAAGLSLRYAEPPAHPPLAAVKTANSRAFGLELERALSDGASPEEYGSLHATLESLEIALGSALAERSYPSGWVAKGDHGHAATANRRIPFHPLGEEDRRCLRQLFSEHGRVVLEPWHERLLDMSVNFTVDPGGAVRDLRGHELVNSRDGAFLGVKIAPSGLPPEPWLEELEASAREVAKALDAVGYFGPVSVDAYVWKAPEGPRLRAVVDINARNSMALPAHGLASRLPGKSLLWMWTKPRKLALPADYPILDAGLGVDAFDPASGLGILAVSPLHRVPVSSNETARPKRVGFLFSAENEEGLARQQMAFASALGRR